MYQWGIKKRPRKPKAYTIWGKVLIVLNPVAIKLIHARHYLINVFVKTKVTFHNDTKKN